MQGIKDILYTPVDFTHFVMKNFTDPNGSIKSSKGLSDNVGLVTKVIKFASTFGFSCNEIEKLDEQCKSFKKVYSLFTCMPNAIDAVKTAFSAPNPANNNFNSVVYERSVQVMKCVKSFFDIGSAVSEYIDPINFKSFTPIKYVSDAMDITETVMGIADDGAKILQEAGSAPASSAQLRVRNLKILSATWGVLKKLCSLAITVLGVLSTVLASSVAVPFFVVPALGVASLTFGLFSKYVDYFAKNPTQRYVA